MIIEKQVRVFPPPFTKTLIRFLFFFQKKIILAHSFSDHSFANTIYTWSMQDITQTSTLNLIKYLKI